MNELEHQIEEIRRALDALDRFAGAGADYAETATSGILRVQDRVVALERRVNGLAESLERSDEHTNDRLGELELRLESLERSRPRTGLEEQSSVLADFADQRVELAHAKIQALADETLARLERLEAGSGVVHLDTAEAGRFSIAARLDRLEQSAHRHVLDGIAYPRPAASSS